MRRLYGIVTALILGVIALPASSPAQRPSTFSLSDLGPVQRSGTVSDSRGNRITWAAGTPAERLFTVGMFQDTFQFQNLSLNQIRALTGEPVTDGPLSSFPLVQNMSVPQLVSAIPGLGQRPVSSSPPIQALAQQQGVSISSNSPAIGQVAPLIQGRLAQLGSQSSNYSLSQIPGLSNVPISYLPDWAQAQIAEIPGLSNVPIVNLPGLDYFVPFDIPFGMSLCRSLQDCREFNIDNTASGNWENRSIPCVGGPCSHIEVKRWLNNTTNIRWVSKEQKVPGGNGFLCSEEPTGRFPFGKNPKVVVENVKEATGEVEFALYFSVKGPFGAESAHCFGPFPMPFWGVRKEGQLILFGLDYPGANLPWSVSPVTGRPSTPISGGGAPPPAPPVDCQDSPSTFIRPNNAPVSSGFGWRFHPITGVRKFHTGIDLPAGYGASILASNCGTVSFAGWKGGYGNYTCISHGQGVETCYAHQSRIPVAVGQAVKRGQVIGNEGSTGFSTGSHLHFEYKVGGDFRNPRHYVAF